eukprot:TRINITY_DN3496_c1_g1_i1.p1 TRINITY_DN3496_c1_g1~~TRINITY_DN3496_c1_g1_i1.p1  ORF type:complete len:112 (-),score=25.29 TRINITY_DN3496_c1_g1_i1:21-356(-)
MENMSNDITVQYDQAMEQYQNHRKATDDQLDVTLANEYISVAQSLLYLRYLSNSFFKEYQLKKQLIDVIITNPENLGDVQLLWARNTHIDRHQVDKIFLLTTNEPNSFKDM